MIWRANAIDSFEHKSLDNMGSTMLATRLSDSFCVPSTAATSNGVLVRIYPVQKLESPIPMGQEGLTLGRDAACDVCVNDDSVSRRHARFVWVGAAFCIEDLGSTNGTYLNEVRVDRATLQPGDQVRIGSHIFRYLSSEGFETQYHEVLFKLMTTDGLTGVYNKRFLMETLDREIQQSRRDHSPLSLMLMDLDKFKSVNDTHGHLAGDAVLVEFARRAMANLRSGEVLARYGGEEFALLCTRATIEEAAQAAERIRLITAAMPVTFETQVIPITVSIGVATLGDDVNHDASKLLAEADARLYLAKQTGRNQVKAR